MEKKTHQLLGALVLTVIVSIVMTYWRSMVQKDFYIILPEETQDTEVVE